MTAVYEQETPALDLRGDVMAILHSKGVLLRDDAVIGFDEGPLWMIAPAVPEKNFRYGNPEIKSKIILYFGVCRGGEILSSPKPNYKCVSDYPSVENKSFRGISLAAAWDDRLSDIDSIIRYQATKHIDGGGRSDIQMVMIFHIKENGD